ncbi:rSAM-modified peptide [Flavobacterium piscis]|jgi:hypothetical protein|uniref:rSAM-modified peptide n=1 Tax=Flavobacterium piscis TaxID=1114874 RepID=UPI000EB216B6|nr:rSAM-modified peptide [Flavobacterium piscis]
MANQKLNISNFESEKLSKKQQKTVSGGDEAIDPSKGDGKGNTVGSTVPVPNQNPIP